VTRLQRADVQRIRMASQMLAPAPAPAPAPATATATADATPQTVAAWFGALQAQDLPAALWAFGVRLPGVDRSAVEAAVSDGSVLRTWAMRGTLHFVAAEDARWLLATAGVRALNTDSQRWRTLGLDQATADAAVDAFRSALDGTRLLTRSAMLAALQGAGISPEGQRGYHLLWYAAQVGVTCVGPNQDQEQTYALLEQWAPHQRDLRGEHALAELAVRYFRSHGPATQQDFQRWTGLTAAASRTGIAAAGGALTACDVAGTAMLAAPATLDALPEGPVVRLLPAFDEFVIGYKDRSPFIPPERMDAVVPGNSGVFRPSVLVDGSIIGTWSRATTKRGVRVRVDYFERPTSGVAAAVDAEVQRYAAYLEVPLLP